jgi:hypothetical protein
MATTVKTGEICQVSAIYKCQTHQAHEIGLDKGHKAPPCDKVHPGHGTVWILVREVHH